MAVDRRQRERFDVQVRDLAKVERDEHLPLGALRRTIDDANRHRRAAGDAPLDECPVPPEAGLYERARALGLRRIDG